MSDKKPLGIDLGTTNSAMAYIDETGKSVMVRNSEGGFITPSVVFFDDQEIIVGRDAKRAAIFAPESVAQCVKRDVGKEHYSSPIRGSYLPPEVIQGCILKKLRVEAESSMGQNLQAVVTVPAYFNDRHRTATANSAEMAGLQLLDIVNEPVAAALAFGESQGYLTTSGDAKQPLNLLIYDLGGGTFDVTIVHLEPGKFQTIATDGDVQLGGHDWDMRLFEHVANTFQRIYGHDVRDDKGCSNLLLESVIEAKHTLTARDRAKVSADHQGQKFTLEITRSQFEEMTADLLERTLYTTREVLKSANMSWSDISRLVLVGGSTRMPMVANALKKLSGIDADQSVNPDEAVARGAVIYANYLLSIAEGKASQLDTTQESPVANTLPPSALPPSAEAVTETKLLSVINVNAHSLGIEGINQKTNHKENKIIIKRNSPLPSKVNKKFVTYKKGQKSIVIQVLEGENIIPAACAQAGRAVIRKLPAELPEGSPIEVTYQYDTSGRLRVWADLPGTNTKLELALEREGGISPEGLSRWRNVVTDEVSGFDEFDSMLDDVLEMNE